MNGAPADATAEATGDGSPRDASLRDGSNDAATIDASAHDGSDGDVSNDASPRDSSNDGASKDASVRDGSSDGTRADADAGSAVTFRKITLHREFYCEGASHGDLNHDSAEDVVAGPFWYEGPDFSVRHEIWSQAPFDPLSYSNCFFQWTHDFDGDGWLDVLVVGFPGQDASWFRNPGDADAGSGWIRHVVVGAVGMESPDFTDVTGDGRPELVFASAGQLGWAGPGADPVVPWVFHALSDVRSYQAFTHGLGVVDWNGDSRKDVVEATGIWEQPADLTGDPLWIRHDVSFGSGGAQMLGEDVDGDGDEDVITSLTAHDYGLAWYEQLASSGGASFAEHVIVSPDPPSADAGVILHQPHALALSDIDGDGLQDVVTGERFWGHVPVNPDFNEPARLYWFRLVRDASGVRFVPSLIDADSGVGTQVTVGDVNGDSLPDIVVSNKKGAFVFLQVR